MPGILGGNLGREKLAARNWPRGMRIASVQSRLARASVPPKIFVVMAAVVAAAPLVSPARAQTLTNPNPPSKWSPPQTAAKSPPAAHEKSCSSFGAGFVNVPGTDTCIKVGGWVEMQSGTSGR
jgi:hypothetical protein